MLKRFPASLREHRTCNFTNVYVVYKFLKSTLNSCVPLCISHMYRTIRLMCDNMLVDTALLTWKGVST